MKKVYFNQIEAKSNELVNFSKNNVASIIEELSVLPQNFVWKGVASETYVNVYKAKIDKLKELNDNVRKIAELLSVVNDCFSDANSRINNAYEEVIADMKK